MVFIDGSLQIQPARSNTADIQTNDEAVQEQYKQFNHDQWMFNPSIDSSLSVSPNTLPTYYDKSQNNKLLPYDYAWHNSQVSVKPSSLQVLYQFPTVNAGIYDGPLTMTVTVKPRGAYYIKRRTITYDRRAINDPAKVQYLKHCLHKLPIMPFLLDPTSHSYVLNLHFKQLLTRIFPLPKVQSRDPILTQATMDLIAQKAQALKIKKALGLQLKVLMPGSRSKI